MSVEFYQVRLEEFFKEPVMAIGDGWDRIAFRLRGLVLKVPKSDVGAEANLYEAEVWSSNPGELVATRILRLDGMPIAVQPYLTEIPLNKVPDWALAYDCAQGGLSRAGRFKIFDFAPQFPGPRI